MHLGRIWNVNMLTGVLLAQAEKPIVTAEKPPSPPPINLWLQQARAHHVDGTGSGGSWRGGGCDSQREDAECLSWRALSSRGPCPGHLACARGGRRLRGGAPACGPAVSCAGQSCGPGTRVVGAVVSLCGILFFLGGEPPCCEPPFTSGREAKRAFFRRKGSLPHLLRKQDWHVPQAGPSGPPTLR